MLTAPTRTHPDRFVVLQNGCNIRVGKVEKRQGYFGATDYSDPALSHYLPFLFWLPGKINFVSFPLGGEVMTGPMSGCLLMTVTWNGVRYAGHLGSEDEPSSDNTLQAWEAWQDWAMENLKVKNIRGFYPARAWTRSQP